MKLNKYGSLVAVLSLVTMYVVVWFLVWMKFNLFLFTLIGGIFVVHTDLPFVSLARFEEVNDFPKGSINVFLYFSTLLLGMALLFVSVMGKLKTFMLLVGVTNPVFAIVSLIAIFAVFGYGRIKMFRLCTS